MSDQEGKKIEGKFKKFEDIPTCNILGVRIAATNMDDFSELLIKNFEAARGSYITVANVHTTVLSSRNDKFRKIQNSAVAALPDGGPLSKIGKRWGYKDMERVTGPDFMERMISISSQSNLSHFFYGSTPETLAAMITAIQNKYPGINIAGVWSPPFRALSEEEDIDIVNMINEVNPDFIWVGLGAPKQEIWMSEHSGKFNSVMVGVGAAFDYYAGNIDRAPEWMQKNCLEWLYRLIQDPRHLFRRYLETNLVFVLKVTKQALHRSTKPSTSSSNKIGKSS